MWSQFDSDCWFHCRLCQQEVQTAQGQQLQLQGEQQSSAAGSYVVRDDTAVMQQVRHTCRPAIWAAA
jgi:hypothetical protein